MFSDVCADDEILDIFHMLAKVRIYPPYIYAIG